ncbi:MAG: ATP-binding protein [Candidatus Hermodarchaeota archaeon]
MELMKLNKPKSWAEKYLDLAGVIIVALDTDGTITLMNKKGYEVLGYEKDELIGKNWIETCVPSYLRIEVFEVFKELMSGEIDPVEYYENPILTKSNKIKIITWHNTLLYDDDKRIIGTLSSGEDSTRLDKMKSDLLERIAHELKTPLVSIKGSTEIISRFYKDRLTPKIMSLLDVISRNTSRLENLINTILSASKLEEGVMVIEKSKNNLSSLITKSAIELQELADLRGHAIKLNIHDNLFAQLDEDKINTVLNDLIFNAIKYTPPNGNILISSEILEEYLLISIKDNGIGFTEEEKSRIFKRFGKIERYGKGWDVGIEGSGLGLYISKKIIELHGGKIWMVSEGRNKGSAFYFTLPI